MKSITEKAKNEEANKLILTKEDRQMSYANFYAWTVLPEMEDFLKGHYLNIQSFISFVKKKYFLDQSLPPSTDKHISDEANLVRLLGYELAKFELSDFLPGVIAAYATIKKNDLKTLQAGLPRNYRGNDFSEKMDRAISILLTATLVAQEMREMEPNKREHFKYEDAKEATSFSERGADCTRNSFTHAILWAFGRSGLNAMVENKFQEATQKMRHIDLLLKSNDKKEDKDYVILQGDLKNHPMSDEHLHILEKSKGLQDLEKLKAVLQSYRDHVATKPTFNHRKSKIDKRDQRVKALDRMIGYVSYMNHEESAQESFEMDWNTLLNNQSDDPKKEGDLATAVHELAIKFMPTLNREKRRIGDKYDRRFEEFRYAPDGKNSSDSLHLIREKIISYQAHISDTQNNGLVPPLTDQFKSGCRDLDTIKKHVEDETARSYWTHVHVRMEVLSVARHAIVTYYKAGVENSTEQRKLVEILEGCIKLCEMNKTDLPLKKGFLEGVFKSDKKAKGNEVMEEKYRQELSDMINTLAIEFDKKEDQIPVTTYSNQ